MVYHLVTMPRGGAGVRGVPRDAVFTCSTCWQCLPAFDTADGGLRRFATVYNGKWKRDGGPEMLQCLPCRGEALRAALGRRETMKLLVTWSGAGKTLKPVSIGSWGGALAYPLVSATPDGRKRGGVPVQGWNIAFRDDRGRLWEGFVSLADATSKTDAYTPVRVAAEYRQPRPRKAKGVIDV